MAEFQADQGPIKRRPTFRERLRRIFDGKAHREPESSFKEVKLKPNVFNFAKTGKIGERVWVPKDGKVRAMPKPTLSIKLGGWGLHFYFSSRDNPKSQGWRTPFGRMTWSTTRSHYEYALAKAGRKQLKDEAGKSPRHARRYEPIDNNTLSDIEPSASLDPSPAAADLSLSGDSSSGSNYVEPPTTPAGSAKTPRPVVSTEREVRQTELGL